MLFNTTGALSAAAAVKAHLEALSSGKLDPRSYESEQRSALNLLQSLVNHAAALSRYFFPSARGKNKSLHEARGEDLRKAYAVKPDSPLGDRGLRNAMEHFDERLDLYFAEFKTGCFIPEFVGLEPKKSGVPAHFFRAFFADTGRFQLLGETFAIQPLLDELHRIHLLLERAYPEDK